MSNHFHVLVRVPEPEKLSDAELMRRYKVLYPKPTKYQTASTSYGMPLQNVEDAIYFNNIHEAMHLGQIKMLLKMVG